jgi:hypothetical protein
VGAEADASVEAEVSARRESEELGGNVGGGKKILVALQGEICLREGLRKILAREELFIAGRLTAVGNLRSPLRLTSPHVLEEEKS